MKVLHVITGLGVGGAELQLRSQLQYSRYGADVVTLYNKGPVADMLESDGVRVIDLGMTSNTQLSALSRLHRLIRAGRYDVVHTHLYRSQVYGRIAAWLARAPVVLTTEHSIGETHLERRRMNAGVRALYLTSELCSQATIAVSDTVRHRLVRWGVPARKIHTIPNGVDFGRVAFDPDARRRIRREFSIPEGTYVVGVLGRLDANKRFDLVIEAIAPLLGDRRRLLIVGKGDERSHLERVAAEHQVTDRVIFAGERHDVAAMLSAMDLFIASSAQETFGLSVLEALANGMPVLYTTCPALQGISVDRAHQVAGTAEGLRGAIDEELAFGPRTRAPALAVQERYGIAAVTAAVDDLYEELLAVRRRPTAGRVGVRGPKPGGALPQARASDLEA